ncbi:MAG: TRAP transporter substrate-binding protein DctP [Pseudomonadota bacterium]
MLRLVLVAALMVVLAALAPALARCDAGEREIKFGAWFDANAFARFRAAGLVQRTVNQEMQGKVCITLTGSADTLGGAAGLSALREGQVQMLAAPFADLAPMQADYGAFQMPFGFRNLAAVERFQKARSVSLYRALESKGLRPLAFWHEGFDHMASAVPVFAPQTLAGKRLWRGESGAYEAFAPPLKAVAHTASENQLELAIKQKRVGVVFGDWTELNASGSARQLGHALEAHVRFRGHQLMAGRTFWDGLEANVRRDLLGIIQRITTQVNFETEGRLKGAMRTLMRGGVKMGTLTRMQREKFRAALGTLRQPYLDASPELAAAIEASNKGL